MEPQRVFPIVFVYKPFKKYIIYFLNSCLHLAFFLSLDLKPSAIFKYEPYTAADFYFIYQLYWTDECGGQVES